MSGEIPRPLNLDNRRIRRHYKELLPNGHLVLVYDSGHAIGAERPEACAEVVTDFLERHEAFLISRAETVLHP